MFPFDQLGNVHDLVPKELKTVKEAMEAKKPKNGLDRLRYMYTVDEFGNLSPEVVSILQVGFFGSFVGVMYGGVTDSRIAYLNFIENNQATKFTSHFEAKRMLQSQVSIAFGKGAWKWGWRLGLFSTCYVLLTTTTAAYRGKSSIWEYLIGGSLTGTLYKFTLGPRGMIVGGTLGLVLGAVAGGLSLTILKATGTTMEDIQYWQYQFHEERQERYRELIRQHKAREDAEILKEHEKNTAVIPISLENVKDESSKSQQIK